MKKIIFFNKGTNNIYYHTKKLVGGEIKIENSNIYNFFRIVVRFKARSYCLTIRIPRWESIRKSQKMI